jgi:CRP-like cAMP-binding protein
MHHLENILKDNLTNYHYKTFDKGQMIYQAGDLCKHLDYIISGKAIIQHISYEGQLMTLATFDKHQTLGTSRLFSDNNHYPMSIVALEKIQLLTLEKKEVLKLCQKNEDFLKWLLNDMAEKSDLLSKRIKHQAFMTIENQVYYFLSQQANEAGHINLNISKKQWAESLGVSRTSLSRVLQNMKTKGMIDYKNRDYILLKKTNQ